MPRRRVEAYVASKKLNKHECYQTGERLEDLPDPRIAALAGGGARGGRSAVLAQTGASMARNAAR